jgi:hypothetical protein
MEEKEKELKESFDLFLNQFDKKDLYTQVLLEMIFEELKKNEKK